MGLGIATVLTISFMRGSMNDNMPKVSYLKSIDYFLLGSFAFVFMTLIEYVLLVKQKRKEKNSKKKKKEKNPFSQIPVLPDIQEVKSDFMFLRSFHDWRYTFITDRTAPSITLGQTQKQNIPLERVQFIRVI